VSLKLPYGGFKWIDNVDINFIKTYDVDNNEGCFIECDLEYPKELHDLHNDYPLAVEQRCIKLNE
jgi:hypothetical protein